MARAPESELGMIDLRPGDRVLVTASPDHFLRHGVVQEIEGAGFTTRTFARVRFRGDAPMARASVADRLDDLVPVDCLRKLSVDELAEREIVRPGLHPKTLRALRDRIEKAADYVREF